MSSPSNLRESARRVSARALASGVQIPIATERVVVTDGGIPFLIHLLGRLAQKTAARQRQDEERNDPFLPPDPQLVVGELSPTHLCVLNKFNVLAEHLLIITRRFEAQDELLNEVDFHALATVMADMGGLGFFNAGTVAGASQEHKHLQVVPTPLGDGGTATPMDAVLDELPPDDPVRHPALHFDHLLVGLPAGAITPASSRDLVHRYRELMDRAGVAPTGSPYNLLLTHRWMMLVPRSSERFEGISVNALGFAGSLLVPDPAALARVREVGPMGVLAAVTRPS